MEKETDCGKGGVSNKASSTWLGPPVRRKLDSIVFPDSLSALFERATQIDSIKVDKSNYMRTFGVILSSGLMEVHTGF